MGSSRIDSIINGKLIGGGTICLSGCHVEKIQVFLGTHSEVTVSVEKAFLGGNYLEENIEFPKYSIKLKGMLNWCGLCHFEYGDNWQYQWIKKECVRFQLKQGISVKIYPVLHEPTRTIKATEEFVLKQEIVMEFEYEQPVCVDTFLADYRVFETLIVIGSGAKPYLEEIKYYDPKNKLFVSGTKHNIIKPLQMFINWEKGEAIERPKHKMLFLLENLNADNQEKYLEWSQKIELFGTIADLYCSISYYNDMSLEMKFLNIMQALETYHSRFRYNNKLKNFKAHVEELFSCTITEVPSPHKEAYYCATQADSNINYIILKTRMVDLFNDDFKCKIGTMVWNGNIDEVYSYIDTIVDTRHYYTHYGKSKEHKALRGEKLEFTIHVLRTLFEYHFLKENKFDYVYIERKISERCKDLLSWYSLKIES